MQKSKIWSALNNIQSQCQQSWSFIVMLCFVLCAKHMEKRVHAIFMILSFTTCYNYLDDEDVMTVIKFDSSHFPQDDDPSKVDKHSDKRSIKSNCGCLYGILPTSTHHVFSFLCIYTRPLSFHTRNKVER